jgi:hypothetical protein
MWKNVFGLIGLVAVAIGCATPSSSGSGPSAPAVNSPAGTQLSSAVTEAEAPIGSWTMTLTAADLTAADFTDPGFVAENTGTFTTTFGADGKWTTAQTTTHPVRWPVFQGTYIVTGPGALEMKTEFPSDYAGDVVAITWTREAEGIRFKLVSPDDPVLRLNLETHPWTPLP